MGAFVNGNAVLSLWQLQMADQCLASWPSRQDTENHIYPPAGSSISVIKSEQTATLQASAEEISVNGFRTVMEIDTIGSFAMSRAAFPALRQRGGGRIVNISATLHYGATWWQVGCSCRGFLHGSHGSFSMALASGKQVLPVAWRACHICRAPV